MEKRDKFFEKMEAQGLALVYDDIRLKTNHSEVMPAQVKLFSRFSRNVPLKQPIVSAAMDTVTEWRMAVRMAELGGLGIIHRNLSLEAQIHHLERVKFYMQGRINKPICVFQDETVESVLRRREEKEYSFHSFLVINNGNKLIGIVTKDDFDFCTDTTLPIEKIMSKNLVVGSQDDTIEMTYQKMLESKKKIIPLLDKAGNIAGMYVWSDVRRIITRSHEGCNFDSMGRLRAGVAIGVGNEALQRAEELIKKGVDVLVVDTAHGDSKSVYETLKELKRNYSVDVVVGNISEPESAKRLTDAGADGIKVGQGPGSICTTRIIAGVGCPQATAVYKCSKAIRGSGVPVCADGGVRYSGDVSLAIALGASSVMIGNLFAGTEESPGEVISRDGKSYKYYRGMGSLAAMEANMASIERYKQGPDMSKLVPEGIEGMVSYIGEVDKIFNQLIGGLRAGMGYVGAKDIEEFQNKSDFHRITSAGKSESHPHNITIIKPAPNYAAGIEEEEI